MTAAASRELFAAAKKVRETPLTLKETHPSWQVKKRDYDDDAEPVRDRQRVKGEWGDMDSLQMLERLEEQSRDEEEKREYIAQRREERAERKSEKDRADAEKKEG